MFNSVLSQFNSRKQETNIMQSVSCVQTSADASHATVWTPLIQLFSLNLLLVLAWICTASTDMVHMINSGFCRTSYSGINK